MANELSFNLEKELFYSHSNDFGKGYVHHLFGAGRFALIWVETVDGIVKSIAPTLREELDTWEGEEYDVTDKEYEEHLNDVKILNESYIPHMQMLIDEL